MHCKLQRFVNLETCKSFLPIGLFTQRSFNFEVAIGNPLTNNCVRFFGGLAVLSFPIRFVKFEQRRAKRHIDSNDLLICKLTKCCNLQYIRRPDTTKCWFLQHFLALATNFRPCCFSNTIISRLRKKADKTQKDVSPEQRIVLENGWFDDFRQHAKTKETYDSEVFWPATTWSWRRAKSTYAILSFKFC